ncbi:acetate--CoA ligase [Deinococcus maricopensis]|uniref:Acetyl-coenzyme A synthetase n=1 Tax=Deinococcus maricopensis (strain DSM 21211 / LMG 22137 / NRRL B-23946 / LB-34) TaxID=709986 RepID=E8U418_DEIML|nr:acetate--CoA ligase [Deinococcus maricopensis]ADV65855.1 Acetyl-coenzyme A synthetase [Deinococcus maricopensis DSM 21211]
MTQSIENVLHEHRRYAPPAEYAARVRWTRDAYDRAYARSLQDPDGFWSDIARELHWFRAPTQALDWQPPHAQWFADGTTNIAYNALDRHLPTRGDARAIVWEGEDGTQRTLTYHELHAQVCQLANALTRLGVHAGDRVTLYLPLIPEAAIAMLACARIGAVHSVVFGGFSASALCERIKDAGSKVLITADGGLRRGSTVNLKASADEALKGTPDIEHVIVVNRTGQAVPMQAGRDLWWDDLLRDASAEHAPAELNSEHPLFILYTSGSTGKPKGVLHTTGGYMVGTYLTTQAVFELGPDDLYWCTADVGWVTGHSYVVYGPLLNGASVFLYEGAPNHPDWSRFWAMIERHRVTVLYTAPTAIRSFMRAGDAFVQRHDLSSLRLLGSVGEPINPEAWVWYHDVVGGGHCPVVDTWWQTETGGIMLTTLPGAHDAKPGSAGLPMFGVDPAIMTRTGQELGPDEGGFLVLKRPWPSMLRTVYGDDDRYQQSYWSEIPGVYFAGDGARRDAEGYVTVIGRIDDVLNVSGHRLGTMELESALVAHPSVAEAAVVGRPDDVKGEGIVAFVTLQSGATATADDVRAHVAREIGAIARPDEIRFADALPKTRSGKIMRRFLRQIAAGQAISGDTSTLEDPAVLERLQQAPAQ